MKKSFHNIFDFMRRRKLFITVLTLVVFVAPIGSAFATPFLTEVQSLETGSSTVNPYATNTGNGAIGAFQQRAVALKDIGYMNSDGSWNAQNSGAATEAAYLQCPSCQIAGETSLLGKDWSYLQSNGTVSQYLGKTGADGNVYNESALLECAQQLGAAGCRQYIATGNCAMCSSNPHLKQDIAAASETDSSAITGGNTIVDNSANAAGGTVSGGTALAQMETYCAPEVNQLMQQMGRQNINAATLMASNAGTGYSLMNGDGVIKAGTSDDGSASYGLNSSGLVSNVFGNVSCLNNMMSGLGLNAIFTPPSLSSLTSQLENQACSALTSQVSQLEQPINSMLGNVNGSVSKYGNMGFFPGMSIASMTGMNLSVSSGGGGVNGSVDGVGSSGYNFTSLMNNTNSWESSVNDGATRPPVTGLYQGLFAN